MLAFIIFWKSDTKVTLFHTQMVYSTFIHLADELKLTDELLGSPPSSLTAARPGWPYSCPGCVCIDQSSAFKVGVHRHTKPQTSGNVPGFQNYG